jgi:AcrR family transcriptional regulator
MGRGKTISDGAVLERLLAAIGQIGPGDLTFSRASRAVGLSAPTLVQRFGTRDAMIEAVLLHAWDRLDAATATADFEAALDPQGAIALLMRLMPGNSVDQDMTDGLLLLREDLRNPALRQRGSQWGARLARALGRRLTNDPEQADTLGWQMASMWQGSLIWWAFRRETDARTAVEAALTDWCRSVCVAR